jgi:hypothetical protein
MFCPRCGIYNPGERQACYVCMGPLTGGQPAPPNPRCEIHPDNPALGKCMTCGRVSCFECASMMDNRLTCITCAAGAVTTSEPTEQQAKPKRRFSFGRKK